MSQYWWMLGWRKTWNSYCNNHGMIITNTRNEFLTLFKQMWNISCSMSWHTVSRNIISKIVGEVKLVPSTVSFQDTSYYDIINNYLLDLRRHWFHYINAIRVIKNLSWNSLLVIKSTFCGQNHKATTHFLCRFLVTSAQEAADSVLLKPIRNHLHLTQGNLLILLRPSVVGVWTT